MTLLEVATVDESVVASWQQEAEVLIEQAKRLAGEQDNATTPEKLWAVLHSSLLTPVMPFALHKACYESVYSNDNNKNDTIIKPCWMPTETLIQSTNVHRMMKQQGFATYEQLYEWSISSKDDFWMTSAEAVGVKWDVIPATAIVLKENDAVSAFTDANCRSNLNTPVYFPGARLNIADSCFPTTANKDYTPAVIYANESDPTALQTMTMQQLEQLTNQVAYAITHKLQCENGSRIAICVPMIPESVAIYLGVVKAGCVVVSIADSFSVSEIATRCRIANVTAVFTQDVIFRGDRALPLASRIWQADSAVRDQFYDQQRKEQRENDGKETKSDDNVEIIPEPMKVIVLPATLHTGSYAEKTQDVPLSTKVSSSVPHSTTAGVTFCKVRVVITLIVSYVTAWTHATYCFHQGRLVTPRQWCGVTQRPSSVRFMATTTKIFRLFTRLRGQPI